MFDTLKKPSLHETIIKIAAYVLSEFGSLIANEKPCQDQFELITNKMHLYNAST
jgi:hypothetical protein